MDEEKACNCVVDFLDEHGAIFSDAIVICQGNFKMNVNKIVLAAHSSFFKKVFSTELEPQTKTVFYIPEVTPDGLKPIIDWMYHKKIMLNDQNVLPVLKDADFLCIMPVIEICSNYFEKEMTTKNVFVINKWAEHYNLDLLSTKSKQFIQNHFESVFKEEEFLSLTEGELCSILEDDRLNVSDEKIVWKAAIRWLTLSNNSNIFSLRNVVKKIRFGLISHDYFQNNITNDLQLLTPIIEPILKDAYVYFENKSTDTGDLASINPYLATPRRPYEFLFNIGGWSGLYPSQSMEVYDNRSRRWKSFDISLPIPLAYHAIVKLGTQVYLVGGITVDKTSVQHCSRNCYKIDLSTGLISELCPMVQKRNFVSLVNIDNSLYAIGGKSNVTEDSRLRTCEKMDTTEIAPKWMKIKSMKVSRSDAGAAVIDGQIYVVGGFDGETVHRSMEVYDPADKKWSYCPEMVCRRVGLSCAEFGGELYVVGGSDGISRLRSVEKFNPKTKKWSVLSPMNFPRSNHGLCVVEGKLVAVGGYNGVEVTDNVEYYDFVKDKWFMTDSLLTAKSGMVSICIERHLLSENVQAKCVDDNKGCLRSVKRKYTEVESEVIGNKEILDSDSSVITSVDSSNSSLETDSEDDEEDIN